ncbi:hypothetical protein QYE76_043525 [Lolium multiflorum]|uniref:Terpene synthase N-terminal domain-containing protein n=1 Tax=Lolium multiflorum TaxID=4521 RepID=A0AAD8TIW9_LOLMU|nr:hypothetical protein QYE76_043525 [Lolium multiflorum]
MAAADGGGHASGRMIAQGYTVLDERRHAVDYRRSVWGDYFIQNPTLPHTHENSIEWMTERRDKLILETREMFLGLQDPAAEMKMIDALQRLGVPYHFKEEIDLKLQKLSSHKFGNENLHDISLQFRLLRQERFYMSCDVFQSFIDNQEYLNATLQNDVRALLALYEAAHLGTPNEQFLKDARRQTTSLLKTLVIHLEKPLSGKVKHALETPSFRRMKRLEARLYIPLYEEDKEECNQIILELAKLDFYLLQRTHRQEVTEVCKMLKVKGKVKGEGEEEARDDPVDDLGRTIADARSCETEKERENLDRMLEDHRKALYPGCDDGLKKLGCTLDLLKWKAQAGVADSAFEDLLKMLKNMFPKNNELPASTYEAKKVVCPLGLEIRGDDPGDDVEGQKPRKKVPAKVMWYAPIIPRLKRLFRNKEHAKLLRWHKEDRKSDGELRHPADGTQWRKIDREFKDFAADARNIRFGLSTDGMNPFGEQSSSHSTWPVTLCIYNLPPWLCMKRKFIMMPVLIQGPKQPGNDIDVYLRPLVDELLQLWGRPGVRVWDEHKEEEFDLRALRNHQRLACS